MSAGNSVITDRHFLCFINFNMVSSLNPVLTSPIRSPSANSSYCPNNIVIGTALKQNHMGKYFLPFYLVSHVVNIEPHVSVPIMHLSHAMINIWVKEHIILIIIRISIVKEINLCKKLNFFLNRVNPKRCKQKNHQIMNRCLP